MPRKGRLRLPDHAFHVQVLGESRRGVFGSETDYIKYAADLHKQSRRQGVAVYAWCLLPKQVNLLLYAGAEPHRISQFMQSINTRHSRFRNRRERVGGSLWKGRFNASPVQWGPWVLACHRYIERLPIAAGLARSPGQYRWSSFRMRTGRTLDSWLGTHLYWEELGGTDQERQNTYRFFVQQAQDPRAVDFIESRVTSQQLTGDGSFIDQVEGLIGERVEPRKQGRPPKAEKPNS